MISSLEKKIAVRAEFVNKLCRYLQKRRQESCHTARTILFDLTYACNLECVGCGVNATFDKNGRAPLPGELDTKGIINILEKLACQVYQLGVPQPTICFGGGEPLLRTDLQEILRSAENLFGRSNLSIDTNGYLLSSKILDWIGEYISKIEFGCEGVENYHNTWRNPRNRALPEEPYTRLVEAVTHSLLWEKAALRVEILFLPTRENVLDFSYVIRHWAKLGVKHFSVHRCIPTGRMASYPWLVPKWEDYVKILEHSLSLQEELDIHIHIHHSIENALSKIVLGRHMPRTYETLCPNWRATVTIDSKGHVHFCPWVVNGCLSRFKLGHATQYDFRNLFVKRSDNREETGCERVCGCAIENLLGSKEADINNASIVDAAACDPLLRSAIQYFKDGNNG